MSAVARFQLSWMLNSRRGIRLPSERNRGRLHAVLGRCPAEQVLCLPTSARVYTTSAERASAFVPRSVSDSESVVGPLHAVLGRYLSVLSTFCTLGCSQHIVHNIDKTL